MKSIHYIRETLAGIPGVFQDVPPDERDRGQGPGVQVQNFWIAGPTGLEAVNRVPDLEDEETGAAGPLEEMFEIGAELDLGQVERALDGPEGKAIKQAVLVKGVDALGWYVSFHYIGAQWGVYIPMSGILHLVDHFNRGLKAKKDAETLFRLAFRAIHQHELFHFAADYMASQWEAILGQPCHGPSRKLKDPVRGYNVLEEQLANAHMRRAFRRGGMALRASGGTETLDKFMALQPPGYREGREISGTFEFHESMAGLALDYARCVPGYGGCRDALDFTRLYPALEPIDWRYCPVILLHDEKRLELPAVDLGLFATVEGIVETEPFQKALKRLKPEIQRAWERRKSMLAVSTALPGADFKRFGNPSGDESIYSVRLPGGYRAHLGYSKSSKVWRALQVGTHKEMGHG